MKLYLPFYLAFCFVHLNFLYYFCLALFSLFCFFYNLITLFLFLALLHWRDVDSHVFKFLFFCFFFNFYMHVYMCTVYVRCPQRSEEAVGYSGEEVTASYGLPYGCWEQNSSLHEEQVFISAEPSLQPYIRVLLPVLGVEC